MDSLASLIAPIMIVIGPRGLKTIIPGAVARAVQIPVSCAQPGAAPPPDMEELSPAIKTKTNDTAITTYAFYPQHLGRLKAAQF